MSVTSMAIHSAVDRSEVTFVDATKIT